MKKLSTLKLQKMDRRRVLHWLSYRDEFILPEMIEGVFKVPPKATLLNNGLIFATLHQWIDRFQDWQKTARVRNLNGKDYRIYSRICPKAKPSVKTGAFDDFSDLV